MSKKKNPSSKKNFKGKQHQKFYKAEIQKIKNIIADPKTDPDKIEGWKRWLLITQKALQDVLRKKYKLKRS